MRENKENLLFMDIIKISHCDEYFKENIRQFLVSLDYLKNKSKLKLKKKI